MNISKRFHLIWLATLTACCTVDAATVTYAGLSYRGRFDSPFYQSIQAGTTYVEDFEDHEVNTPGLSLPIGNIPGSPIHSVDEDDGTLDNFGQGWYWFSANSVLAPEGFPYTYEIRFSRNGSGQFPTHAGAVLLGFTTNPESGFRYFQAFDAAGEPILDTALTALVPVFPGTTSPQSTKGDQLFGLIYEAGISRIILGPSRRMDHVQYGYGPIPEPAAGILSAGGMLVLALRRKRPVP